ncbi:MAG: NusG domain II-containing protein [Candidatus Latescibacterota bacterium]
MDRRGFLTYGSKVLTGVALAATSGVFPRRLLAAESSSFSIDVVTQHPDLAIQKVTQIIQHSELGRQTVGFSEFPLAGSHVGDIAFVHNNQLVNFHTATDSISLQLKEVASALSLPQTYQDPTLLRFYTAQTVSQPTHAQVFCGDVLVKELPLQGAKDVHRLDGTRGYLEVAVGEGSAKIVHASCKHKTCMKMGAIRQAGQSLVCIPAQLSVSIAGQNGLGVDGVTF